MKKKIKQELYASPEVEVMEAQTRQVICQSTTVEQKPLDGYTDFEW